MENKNIGEIDIKLNADVTEITDAIKKITELIQLFNTVNVATPLPVSELKEGFAEIQPVPQMPEEKQRLVKILMELLETSAERVATLGNDPDDIQSIYNLSKVIADLVK